MSLNVHDMPQIPISKCPKLVRLINLFQSENVPTGKTISWKYHWYTLTFAFILKIGSGFTFANYCMSCQHDRDS